MTAPAEVLDEAIRALSMRGHAGPEMYWRANDVLAALDAAGFTIVPKVPTPEMVVAGRAELKPDDLPADDSDVRVMWTVMLAAAPQKENQK